MPKRISETALSTSVLNELRKSKRRKTGLSDTGDGPSTIPVETHPWFEIPEIVEKILSYLDNPPDIARAERVNNTFQSRSWRIIKELDFYLSRNRWVGGPFPGFSKDFLPSDMADVIPIIWKKCRNLRSLCVFSVEERGETTKDFLLWILELQRLMKRKIEILDFSYAAMLSPALPPLIELCSDSLTTLRLAWDMDTPDSATYHTVVVEIARAVRHCRNLKYFRSEGSPNGIGKLFTEISDKSKLEVLDLPGTKFAEYYHDEFDLIAEMPVLAECLSGLQSTDRSPTKPFQLNLPTVRELSALVDAGNSKNIEWNMITVLGESCICDDCDPGEEWSKQKLIGVFHMFPELKYCGFRVAGSEDRDSSGLVESFLECYRNATGKRSLKVVLDNFGDDQGFLREMGKLLFQVKNSTGISGTLVVDGLEDAGHLDPAKIDIVSRLSGKFVLGSAECTVVS